MSKPNIIVFMTDHQRGDTILEGSRVKTPNLDRFRQQSVTFSNSYCPAPHCCPSRATFFTGLYPSQHGVWNNVGVSNALSFGLFDDTPIFSQQLKAAGYNLYFSGKWHVSAEQGPAEFGFELLRHNNGYAKHPNKPDSKEWGWYSKSTAQIDKGNEPRTEGRIVRPGYNSYCQYGIDEHPFHDDEVVEAAVRKLEELDTDTPFFLYAGTLGPHDPYYVPQRFLDMYDINEIELPESFGDDMQDKPALYRRTAARYKQLTREEHRESIRRFYAFCSYEDYLFGQILDAAEHKGIMDNTLILYVSDHGDYIGSHGLWAKGLPCFHEAYHVCGMLGGGLIVKPGRVESAAVSLADWAPTFLELAGLSPAGKMAGKSLMPFIQNESPSAWRTHCFTQSNGNEIYGIQRAVWNGKWKYVFNSFDFDELYDLETDSNEIHNLLHGIEDITQSQYASVVRELCSELWQFAYRNQDNCVNPYIMTALAPYGPGIIFCEELQENDTHGEHT